MIRQKCSRQNSLLTGKNTGDFSTLECTNTAIYYIRLD